MPYALLRYNYTNVKTLEANTIRCAVQTALIIPLYLMLYSR